MIVEKIEAALAQSAREREDWAKIGASNAGQCARKLWYTVHGYKPEPLQGRALAVFALGDAVEGEVIALLEKSGVAHIRATREQDAILLPEIGGRVVPDFLAEVDGELLIGEVKSMSNFAFARAERGEIDETYLAQVECYMRAFDCRRSVVICYRKETSHLCEVVVERDDQRWAAIQANVALARGPVCPERPYQLQVACESCGGTGRTPAKGLPHKACGGTGREPGGPFIPNFPCGYCGHKASCWGLLEMVVDDDRPRWGRVREAA